MKRHYSLFVGLVVTAAQAPLAAQAPCPGGRQPAGDLGIEALRCTGPAAACAIFVDAETGGPRHVFSVEPVVARVKAEPAGIQPGDTLVALDGRLVTTLEGGRYLAQLPPAREVTIMLRRDGELVERTVTAARGCGIRSLSVSPTD